MYVFESSSSIAKHFSISVEVLKCSNSHSYLISSKLLTLLWLEGITSLKEKLEEGKGEEELTIQTICIYARNSHCDKIPGIIQ